MTPDERKATIAGLRAKYPELLPDLGMSDYERMRAKTDSLTRMAPDLPAVEVRDLPQRERRARSAFDRIYQRDPERDALEKRAKKQGGNCDSITKKASRSLKMSVTRAVAQVSEDLVHEEPLPEPSTKCQGCGRIMSRITRFCAECEREGSAR